MYQVANFFSFLALSPLIVALWIQGGIFLISLPDLRALLWFGVGLLGTLLLGLVLRGAVLHFSELATHEMTHALVGFPLLGAPTKLQVTADTRGGAGTTTFGNPQESFLVLIAPYSFPILAMPLLIIKFLPFAQTAPASIVIDMLLGAALGFHYVSIWHFLGTTQTDFLRAGAIAGFSIAMTFQLLFLIVALCALMGMPGLIGGYAIAALARTRDYYGFVFAGVSRSLAELAMP
jgi:hypothetical protein